MRGDEGALDPANFFARYFHRDIGKWVIGAEKSDFTDMARPKKDKGDVRQRWAVLNASPAEREVIEGYAREAGLSTCSYILRRALQRPASPRQDRQLLVRQQAQIQRSLDAIAASLLVAEPVRDAGLALLALRRIDTSIAAWSSGTSQLSDSDEDDGEVDRSC
ncbi:MAG: hypothetical protein CFE32_15745 [Alphaproteobacteria bacterium PA3]|nr:MAG: hypothetical protein CFE32_15745 [Alphaproteobacteria bacterium PA3]